MRVEVVQNEPALILRGRKRYLIVGDLHLGLVRFADEMIVRRLERLVEDNRIDEVVIAGDLKHNLGYERIELNFEYVLVKGNHDGKLKGEKEVELGKYTIMHGHRKPDDLGKYVILAHSHPSVTIDGVKERVFLLGDFDRKIVVLPAFNEFCSSTPVNLRRPVGFVFRLYDPMDFKALTLDCVMLGEVRNLPSSSFLRPQR